MDKRKKRPVAKSAGRGGKRPGAKRLDIAQQSSFELFKWSLKLADSEEPCGFNDKVFREQWCGKILPQLSDYEAKTWSEISSATAGSKGGWINHHFPVKALVERARERLRKTSMDDEDVLYSLRLGEKQRLFGIVREGVMNLLWYDPDHEICPTSRN